MIKILIIFLTLFPNKVSDLVVTISPFNQNVYYLILLSKKKIHEWLGWKKEIFGQFILARCPREKGIFPKEKETNIAWTMFIEGKEDCVALENKLLWREREEQFFKREMTKLSWKASSQIFWQEKIKK